VLKKSHSVAMVLLPDSGTPRPFSGPSGQSNVVATGAYIQPQA